MIHPFKNIGFVMLASVFLVAAFGSGSDDKKGDKQEWKNQSKESFCGLKFSGGKYTKAIDMRTNYTTTFNCDGTFSSSEDWKTSKRNEDTYNKTVGRSSGNFGEFSGTWDVVDGISPSDASMLANPLSSLCSSTEKTIIKYSSSNGKQRYAMVCKSEDKLYLLLIPFISDLDQEGTYEQKDLGMYEGICDF
jgi:hypothetical protein